MSYSSVFMLAGIVILTFSVFMEMQTSGDTQNADVIRAVVQNQIIGFVSGAVSIVIAIVSYLLARRAADERRDEAISARIREISKSESDRTKLEILSKINETYALASQADLNANKIAQDMIRLEREISELKVQVAKLEARK